MTPDELLAMLQVRGWIYKFLSVALYEEPAELNLKVFLNENLFSLLAEDGEEDIIAAQMAGTLESMKLYKNEDWEELRQDHIALFTNSGPILATPWESVYLSEEKILYDEHTLAVQNFYKKWGFTYTERERGPGDHAGVECGFMSILITLGMKALEEGRYKDARLTLEAQIEFLKEHLLLFADQFCEKIAAGAKSDFYRNIAQFLPPYLSSDAELLQAVLAE